MNCCGGEIAVANIILSLLAPKPTGHGVGEKEAAAKKRKTECQKEVLDKTDLTRLEEWSQNKKEAWELMREYTGIFAMSDTDLG